MTVLDYRVDYIMNTYKSKISSPAQQKSLKQMVALLETKMKVVTKRFFAFFPLALKNQSRLLKDA